MVKVYICAVRQRADGRILSVGGMKKYYGTEFGILWKRFGVINGMTPAQP